MKDKKKRLERFYLDEFLKLLGVVPDNIQEIESPDFILDINKIRIGVELTEFHSDSKGEHGQPRRLIEESWKSLQQSIMDSVRKNGELDKTCGFLNFRVLDLPPKSKYDSFIKELILLSLDMIKTNIQRTKPGPNFPLLRKYLKEFELKKTNIRISWEWNYIADSIGLTEPELINAIQPKIERSSDYKEKGFDELWLLIVSGSYLSQTMPTHLGDILQSFDMADGLLKESFFKKVYIYQYMLRVIYEWPDWLQIGEERFYPTISA